MWFVKYKGIVISVIKFVNSKFWKSVCSAVFHKFAINWQDDEDSLALVFQHVKPEDAGLYTCVASTSSGKISCSAELTVQGQSVQSVLSLWCYPVTMLLFPLISQQNFLHIFSTLTKLPVSYISITFLMSIIHDKFYTETYVEEYWFILFNIYV
jgi:hypothetical protein